VFPFSVFTDRHGRIITVHVGELHEAAARAILGAVAQVDAGQLDPKAAQKAIEAALSALPAEEEAHTG
jgi:hypothetical protein